MATAPTLPLVPVDEYLNTSYRPDVDYVDGVLVERGVRTFAHGVLQKLLLVWFTRFEKQLGFMVVPEVRTQIIRRARYRIPDVMLCALPVSRVKVVEAVPWAVIEILSPDDRMNDMLERFGDYERIGVHSIVLMDPERLVAHRYDAGSLIQTAFENLPLPGDKAVPFSTAAIFSEMQEALGEMP